MICDEFRAASMTVRRMSPLSTSSGRASGTRPTPPCARPRGPQEHIRERDALGCLVGRGLQQVLADDEPVPPARHRFHASVRRAYVLLRIYSPYSCRHPPSGYVCMDLTEPSLGKSAQMSCTF